MEEPARPSRRTRFRIQSAERGANFGFTHQFKWPRSGPLVTSYYDASLTISAHCSAEENNKRSCVVTKMNPDSTYVSVYLPKAYMSQWRESIKVVAQTIEGFKVK